MGNTSQLRHSSCGNSRDISMFTMQTRILKRSIVLLVIFLLKLISGRPQTNPPPQITNGSECGTNYCEEVPNYPDKIIIKLLEHSKILPGTFDGVRQGKRSLSVKNDHTEYDLINFIN